MHKNFSYVFGSDIDKMKKASKIAKETLLMLRDKIKPGITTQEINDLAHDFIVSDNKARPATLNYNGFKHSLCTSVNYVVCHGVPSKCVALKDGDIINIDVTVEKDGFYGDTSMMYEVGEISRENKLLIECAKKCLNAGIAAAKIGDPVNSIGIAIEKCLEDFNKKNNVNFDSVKDYCGHGIGREFHTEPNILHFDSDEYQDCLIEEGMSFTIEPMINAGSDRVKILKDGWTVVTCDRKNSAQWEHTLWVGKDKTHILTK